MQVIIFSSPSRKDKLSLLIKELKYFEVAIIDDPATFGKENFWKRWEQARQHCLNSKHDDYLILPDDIDTLDIEQIEQIAKDNRGKLFTCNLTNDGRKECWGGAYFDCGGITNRATLSKVIVTKVEDSWFKRRVSSGVGHQLTMQLRNIGANIIMPDESLCNHGDHESIMHPTERKRTPLIAKRRLKIVVGIATFKGREKSLEKTIESLRNQCDRIIIYDNEVNPDLTDNGKFYGLTQIKEPCYYFTCDDDLLYPPDYCAQMINAIERTGTIVTHHGRKLKGLDHSYYRGHQTYRYLGVNQVETIIDVPGTGVTAFRTDYFNPVGLHESKDKRMNDLVFALEACKQGKQITVLKHHQGWINQLPIDNATSIHSTEHKNEQRQIQIANQIWKLNYQKDQKI